MGATARRNIQLDFTNDAEPLRAQDIPYDASNSVKDKIDGLPDTLVNLSDVSATTPAVQDDNGRLLGSYFEQAVGYGDGSDGSIAPTGEYNVHQNEGAHTDLTANLNAGNTVVTVRDTTGFLAGDLVIIHQVQVGGGGGLTPADAGLIEELAILSVDSGTQVTLSSSNAVTFKSAATGDNLNQDKAQMVKVVQYNNVDLTSGYLTCDRWDGYSGGLLAFFVSGEISGSGNVDASNKGFHGGWAKRGEGWLGGVRDTDNNIDRQNTAIDCGGASGPSSTWNMGGGCKFDATDLEPGRENQVGKAYVGGTEADLDKRVFFGGGGGYWGGITVGTCGGGGAIFAKVADFTTTGYSGSFLANGTGGFSPGAGGSVAVFAPTVFPAGQITVNGTTNSGATSSVGFEGGIAATFGPTADFRYVGTVDADNTLGGGSASDNKIPTQLAVKEYVDSAGASSYVRITGTGGSPALAQYGQDGALGGTFVYTLSDLTGTGYDSTKVKTVYVRGTVWFLSGLAAGVSAKLSAKMPDGVVESVLEVVGNNTAAVSTGPLSQLLAIPIAVGQTTLELQIATGAPTGGTPRICRVDSLIVGVEQR